MQDNLVLLGLGCGLNEVIAAEQVSESEIPNEFYLIVREGNVLGVACEDNPSEFILAFSTRDEADATRAIKDLFGYGKANKGLAIEPITRSDIEAMCDRTSRFVMIDPYLSFIEKSKFFNAGAR